MLRSIEAYDVVPLGGANPTASGTSVTRSTFSTWRVNSPSSDGRSTDRSSSPWHPRPSTMPRAQIPRSPARRLTHETVLHRREPPGGDGANTVHATAGHARIRPFASLRTPAATTTTPSTMTIPPSTTRTMPNVWSRFNAVRTMSSRPSRTATVPILTNERRLVAGPSTSACWTAETARTLSPRGSNWEVGHRHSLLVPSMRIKDATHACIPIMLVGLIRATAISPPETRAIAFRPGTNAEEGLARWSCGRTATEYAAAANHAIPKGMNTKDIRHRACDLPTSRHVDDG